MGIQKDLHLDKEVSNTGSMWNHLQHYWRFLEVSCNQLLAAAKHLAAILLIY